MDQIPVISLNLSGLESNPGFSINLSIIRKMVAAIAYGDALMALSNQIRPMKRKRALPIGLFKSGQTSFVRSSATEKVWD